MFENAGYDKIDKLQDFWEQANHNPGKEFELIIVDKNNNDYDVVYITAYEFGEVDEKWMEFINDKFLDSDDLKHYNYYIVD
jgi:hypothetical protein